MLETLAPHLVNPVNRQNLKILLKSQPSAFSVISDQLSVIRCEFLVKSKTAFLVKVRHKLIFANQVFQLQERTSCI